MDTTDPEQLCAQGVLLMIAVKGVAVGWIGLDPDAWYVWPWTWAAFAMMTPAVVDWVNESRGT